MKRNSVRVAAVLSLLLLASCAQEVQDPAPAPPPAPAESDAVCAKCDGPFDGAFDDAFSDMRDVRLDDLVGVGAKFATDEVNDQLSNIPYADLEVSPTELYGPERELFGETLVHDMNELHAGLTERLGEHAFATRVNGLRSDTLRDTPDTVFAESHFKIGAAIAPRWSVDVGDGSGGAGFRLGEDLEAVVIAPYRGTREAVVRAPLEALAATRGFILPTRVDDIVVMAPGESVALRSRGGLGFNLGVGVPFYVASVADGLVLRTRLSLGARVSIDGTLDVQIVRGAGNTAWIDVGVTDHKLRHFDVAVKTGWGVEGLPEVDLDLGPVNIDIDRLAEKALTKQLDKHVSAGISGSTTNEHTRLTVARFRFDLTHADSAFDQALTQAALGDIRLAQALANRPDTGVIQELDLTKDHRTEADHLGFWFLGMEFYRTNNYDTGTVTIEADGENQTLLYSEIERKSGAFFTHRGAAWRNVVSVTRKDGEVVDAQVNARLTITESDSWTSRDQILDHADPLLSWQLGHLNYYNEPGRKMDELIAWIDSQCVQRATSGGGRNGNANSARARRIYQRCLREVVEKPEVAAAQMEARVSFADAADDELRKGFDPEIMSDRDLAERLFEYRLAHSSYPRPNAALTGPEGQMVTQVRFSQDAVEHLFAPGRGLVFRQSLADVLHLMAMERDEDFDDKKEDADRFVDKREERLDEMLAVYDDAVTEYRRFDTVASARFDGERVGDQSTLVIVSNDDVTVASVAEHKGRVVEQVFPTLTDLAEDGIFGDLDEPGAFVVGYAFLHMVEPSQVELMSTASFEGDRDGVSVYARGTSEFIDAGRFDLDELLAR